jgi:hypothetical protein
MGRVTPVGEDAIEPFAMALGVLAYGIAANVFYSLGSIIETFGRKTDEVHARVRAEKRFFAGMWFSCLLTTARFWFGLVFWLTHRNH